MSELTWLSLSEVAALLHDSPTKVRGLVREGQLLSARVDGEPKIPDVLLEYGEGGADIPRYLPGVVTLLRDNGFSDAEALEWLLDEDESLGMSPAKALQVNLHREVSRRAQALA